MVFKDKEYFELHFNFFGDVFDNIIINFRDLRFCDLFELILKATQATINYYLSLIQEFKKRAFTYAFKFMSK